MKLDELSNEQLLTGLHALMGQGRWVLARLLAYLAEVEERRLDLESAFSSLFDYCVRRLGMGDDEACRRVAAARLCRRFPIALGMIERGELHLTGLLLLREHLTDINHEELLRAACAKTKIEVQHMLAERFPRPDAPTRVELLSDAQSSHMAAAPATGVPSTSNPSRAVPLSAEKYKVQFTASAELKEKIERAANLMVPVGTALSGRPPDRAPRAVFPHEAPTFGLRASEESLRRPGVHDSRMRKREPSFEVLELFVVPSSSLASPL